MCVRMLVTNAAIDSALRAYLSSADGNKVVPSATNENNPAKQTAVRRRNTRQTRPRECGTKRYSNACFGCIENLPPGHRLGAKRERIWKRVPCLRTRAAAEEIRVTLWVSRGGYFLLLQCRRHARLYRLFSAKRDSIVSHSTWSRSWCAS